MKLIVISGAKHSKKSLVAFRLAQNSDCIWIKPYSDMDVPANGEPVEDRFIHLNSKQLDDKMEREVPLASVEVNGNRYVFFENQLKAEYVVMVGDDRIVAYLKGNYGGDLVTVRCHSRVEEYSDRDILSDREFDIVFDYDSDDFDTLVAEIEDIYNFEVK